MDNPPGVLKPLGRFIKTAQQIEKHEPVVAWCCRHYAAKLGMELRAGSNDPAILQYLGGLMDVLESDKPTVDNLQVSKEEYMAGFADRVFQVADTEYQAGKATKNTAKSFLHAAVFLEALRQFNPLDDEILGKIRYAKWKATDIMTALKEGRVPMPDDNTNDPALEAELDAMGLGQKPAPANVQQPPVNIQPNHSNGLHDSSHDIPDVPVFGGQAPYHAAPPRSAAPTRNDSPSNADLNLPDVPTFVQKSTHQPQQLPQNPVVQQPQPKLGGAGPVAAPQPKPAEPISSKPSSGFSQFINSRAFNPNNQPSASIDVILEATKFSKNAISALQFDDTQAAIKNLKAALRILTGEEYQ